MYLTHHRENIVAQVNVRLPVFGDRNERRKALEQEARAQFRKLPEEEQQVWVEQVKREKQQHAEGAENSHGDHACARGRSRGSPGTKHRLAPAKAVPVKRARATQAAEADTLTLEESGACGAGVWECIPASGTGVWECAGARERIPASGAGVRDRIPAASHPMTPPRRQQPHIPSLAHALEHSGAKDRHNRSVDASQAQPLPEYVSMRHRLGKSATTLEKLYGDAGAAEVQAASLRILSAILPQLSMQKQSDAVKVAVVVGLAAKLTQTAADPTYVKKLWAALVGRSNEALVVKLEPKVLNMWAAQSLDSEYWPQALCASTPGASPQ